MSATTVHPLVAQRLDEYQCDEQAHDYADDLADNFGFVEELIRSALRCANAQPEEYASAAGALRDERESAFRAGWQAARAEQNRA